jgi:hypothetical protein
MQQNPRICNMQEKNNKLLLWFKDITSISNAIKILRSIS